MRPPAPPVGSETDAGRAGGSVPVSLAAAKAEAPVLRSPPRAVKVPGALPVTGSASRARFRPPLSSRSKFTWQRSHTKRRSPRLRLAFTQPHPDHVLDD